MRIPLNGTSLILAAVAATLAALIFPLWSYADRSGTPLATLDARTTSTRYGPLSALDRDFIAKVRLAGLWELPAGQQAEQRGTSTAVRTAGQHLVSGHTSLDAHVRDVAARLRIDLPTQPNAQQQLWLKQLSTSPKGEAYDRAFANVLRLAHGRVFTLVAQIRSSTRNSLVRDLADDANSTVLDHISVLERTGLVNYDAMAADSPASTAAPSPAPPPAPGPTK